MALQAGCPGYVDPVDYAPQYVGTFIGFLTPSPGTGFDMIPHATLTATNKNQLRLSFSFLDPDHVVCDDGTGVSITTSANGASITGHMHCEVSNDATVGSYILDFLGTGSLGHQSGSMFLPGAGTYTSGGFGTPPGSTLNETTLNMAWRITLTSGASQDIQLIWFLADRSQFPADFAAPWVGTYSGSFGVQGGGSDQIPTSTITELPFNTLGFSFTFLDSDTVQCDDGSQVYMMPLGNNQLAITGRQHCIVYNDPNVGTYTLDFIGPGWGVLNTSGGLNPQTTVSLWEPWKATLSNGSTADVTISWSLTKQ